MWFAESQKRLNEFRSSYTLSSNSSASRKFRAKFSSPPSSSNTALHHRFSECVLHGFQLRIRIKIARDLRMDNLYRSELKSTENKMWSIAQDAGWSRERMNAYASQIRTQNHRKIRQFEQQLLEKEIRRKAVPRGQRKQMPISPLARYHAKALVTGNIQFDTPKRDTASSAPKMLFRPAGSACFFGWATAVGLIGIVVTAALTFW